MFASPKAAVSSCCIAFEPPPAAMLPTERSTGVSSALALSGPPLSA